jgi:UDPglucose 6-dehydrogenase
MNWESAELTKYAANSMLAARISFMNEMTILCEAYGADIEDIRKGIGSDSRIGPAFLRAGCGYGGSCFPKDVAALEHISRAAGHESLFVNAIQTINKNQKKRFVDKIEAESSAARSAAPRSPSGVWPSKPTPTTSANPPPSM